MRLEDRASQFAPQDVANSLWGLATAGDFPDGGDLVNEFY